MSILPQPLLFEWDAGNMEKSSSKHHISPQESEEPFFDEFRKLWKDTPHSGLEKRYILLGQSQQERILFVAFTLRGQRVRVISARLANKKERIMYEIAKAKKISAA